MPSIINRLRRTHPYLTPPFVGDDDETFGRPLVEPRRFLNPPLLTRDPVEIEKTNSEAIASPVMRSLPSPIVLTRNGRPDTVYGEGTDLERATAKRRALEDYQPRNEDWKHLLLRTGLGFIGGGIPGAAMTFGMGALDRKAGDRAWRNEQLAQSDEVIGRLRADRRAGLQDRLLESQVAENEAQAQRALGNYDWMPNPADPEGSDIYSAVRPGAVRTLRRKPLTEHVPLKYERKNADGSTTLLQSFDNGKSWEESGLGSAPQPVTEPPRIDYSPDIQGIEDRIKGYQTELSQHQREIATKHGLWKSQAEAKYQAALQSYNAAIANGDRPAKPIRKDFYDAEQASDPHYADGTYEQVNNRIKELQDAIKQESGNMEGLRRENRSIQVRPRRQISDGVEQRIREAAKAKGLDPDEAARRYREGRY